LIVLSHRGSANTHGTEIVNDDTQPLIGPISKLITDLLVFRTGIDLDTPITLCLPTLANGTSLIKWENITLAALANHLSGIPPNYGFSEFYYLQPLLEGLAFPALQTENYAECGITWLKGACSQEGMLTQIDPNSSYCKISID
jgi:CubicO group peptidase (beta-lactamase class C family)